MKKINYKREGNKFHKKVERILHKSGFKILMSDPNRKGPDIIAECESKKIIVQCKHSPEGNYYQKLDDEVDSYASKKRKYGADVAIIALSGYRHKDLKQSTLEGWITDGVAIWTDAIINNYDSLVRSIGTYTKYQILEDLGLNIKLGENITLPGIEIKQHKSRFFITKITPKILLKISYVARIAQKHNFYQRYLSKKRVLKEIPDYINNQVGLFPNNIILASSNKLKVKKNKINLPLKIGQFWIIDGQHRLYSFCNVSDKNLLETYELPCTIFDGSEINPREQARIFEKINSKARKTPASLIGELSKVFGFESDRGMYLLKKMEKTPYFKDKIKWYSNKNGSIDATTFTDCAAIKDLIRDSGILLRGKANLTNDKKNKICYSYIYSFFKIVYNNFRSEWSKPKRYILCTNEGYRSLLRLFIKTLKYTNHRKDEKKFRNIIKAFKRSNPLIRTEDTRGKFAGEGGALRLADEWAKGINQIIVDFDKSLRKNYGIQIDSVRVFKGDLETAENFLESHSKKIKNVLNAELSFIDISTIDYLDKYFSHCDKWNIVFSKMASDDKKKIDTRLKELNLNNKKVVLTQCEKIHERWIGDNNFYLDLDADLKKNALANSDHDMKFFQFETTKEKIENFNERWKQYKNFEGRKIIFDWSLERENENNS